jgi:hypothetical protein
LFQHGRDPMYPIYRFRPGGRGNADRTGTQHRFIIRASNLIPGLMEIPVVAEGLKPKWESFVVEHDHYEDRPNGATLSAASASRRRNIKQDRDDGKCPQFFCGELGPPLHRARRESGSPAGWRVEFLGRIRHNNGLIRPLLCHEKGMRLTGYRSG